MKDNQNNFEDKLNQFPTHRMSKSNQDHIHNEVMSALEAVEFQHPGRSRMLMKRIQIGISSAVAVVLLGILGVSFGLDGGNQAVEPGVEQTQPTNEEEQIPNEQITVEQKATEIYQALHNRDMDTLSNYVHSEKGLTLSILFYLEEYSVVYEKNEVPTLLQDNTEYMWGIGEATSEIKLTTSAYVERYLKPDTFLNESNQLFDTESQRSDMNEYIKTVFPDSKIVEYYNDIEYEDWKSVHLVFEPNEQAVWELVAVLSSEWTP
ncbi:hypothetical protein [Bacillus sp. AK128]